MAAIRFASRVLSVPLFVAKGKQKLRQAAAGACWQKERGACTWGGSRRVRRGGSLYNRHVFRTCGYLHNIFKKHENTVCLHDEIIS